MSEDSKNTTVRSVRFFIVLFVLSIALNVFLFFRYVKTGVDLESENVLLTELLKENGLQKDSLQQELDQVYDQLKIQIEETLLGLTANNEQKEEIERMQIQLEKQRQRIAYLISQGSSNNTGVAFSSLSKANEEILKLKKENAAYITELKETQELFSIAQEAADRFNLDALTYLAASDSLDSLYNLGLIEAKVLRVHDLNVIPVRRKNDAYVPTTKASKIVSLKIAFVLVGSSIVDKGPKEITIRILGTNGEVLSDDVDQLTNSSELYSLKYQTEYEGADKSIVLSYVQKAAYKAGPYTIELYSDGQLLDIRKFTLY